MLRKASGCRASIHFLFLILFFGLKPAAAQVFLSEAEALKIIDPQAEWTAETKRLDEPPRRALAARTRLPFPETVYRFEVGRARGEVAAYALTLDEIGKSEPITFTVGLDPAGRVMQVILLVFRESRGGEVRDKRFLKQFKGKSASDAIQVNDDILNYSGATLSSKAIARGVRKAIALFHHFYTSDGTRGARIRPGPARFPSRAVALRSEGVAGALAGPEVRYVQARYLMGTVCAVELYAPDRQRAEQAANAAFRAMQDVEQRMSSFLPESELSRLNRGATAGRPVQVSPQLFEVLDFAQRVSQASEGAFDITVAPLLRAWGFLPAIAGGGEAGDQAGTDPAFLSLRKPPEVPAAPGYGSVRLSPQTSSVQYTHPEVEIDLGGIAKGFAVDKAVEALRHLGIRKARVSTGGSTLYALGSPPHDPAGWSLTLPTGETLRLRNAAVSSSGHSEHFVEISGRRYSHIFNPQLGAPVATDVTTVSVLAPTAMASDALTKPFFILNQEKQKELLRQFPGTRAFVGYAPARSARSAPPSKEAP